ncbi:hypothetical protein ACTGZQ_09300 [Streptococcus suis]
MSKKCTRLILVMSAICIAIGGMIMFSFHRMSEEVKLQAQIRKEQERMVLYAVNHYEGIEKIEFTSFEENRMTGAWYADATINGEISVSFTAFGFDGNLGMSQNSSRNNGMYLKKRENPTESKAFENVQVLLFEEEK